MYEPVSQLRFAADLVVFIVAMAGVIVAARPNAIDRDPVTRTLFAAGFLARAAAAFLEGTFIIVDYSRPALVALRVIGIAFLATACLRWAARSWTRALLLVGLVAFVADEVLLVKRVDTWRDAVAIAGGLFIGVALVRAARNSIPARIGTIASGLLLVVVLALSVALSVVIDRNVVHSAYARYKSRAAAEVSAARSAATDQLVVARVFGGALAGSDASSLIRPWVDGTANDVARLALAQRMGDLRRFLGVQDPVLFVSPHQLEVAVGEGLDTTTRLALAGSQAVTETLNSPAGQGRQDVAVVANRMFAVAAYPIPAPSGSNGRSPGVIVVARPLDGVYLQVRADSAGEPLSLALVDAGGVIAATKPEPAPGVLRSEARHALRDGATRSRTSGRRFVVTQPILGADGSPRAALVLSAPTSAIDQTRRDLLRSLFLVAAAASIIAALSAILAGERIGAGLRRLTRAAVQIRGGDLSTRSGLTSPDELGVLAETFDGMAGSLETMTGDLRRSVEDEARLRARLEAVIGGMGEALVAVDADGIVTECNRAAEELLGRSRADAVGCGLPEVMPVVDGFTPRLGERGAVRAGESLVRTVDGTDVPVAMSIGPLSDLDGSSAGAVVVLRDLRQEREVERLKTEFLSNISHELRTPLTPIKGYADLLASRRLKAEQTERFAKEITGSVHQLERVIGQLVNFATAAAGRLDLAPEPVRAARVVGQAMERWRPRVDSHHRLTRRVERGTPDLFVDPHAIGQALDELIDNAVKYSPDGGRVSVTCQPARPDRARPAHRLGSLRANGTVSSEPDGRHLVRLAVSDEGIGVSPDAIVALAEDFSQGDGSATRRFAGLGLGLALVERIVRAHGGWVECSSEAGRGSTFSIVVPAAG